MTPNRSSAPAVRSCGILAKARVKIILLLRKRRRTAAPRAIERAGAADGRCEFAIPDLSQRQWICRRIYANVARKRPGGIVAGGNHHAADQRRQTLQSSLPSLPRGRRSQTHGNHGG